MTGAARRAKLFMEARVTTAATRLAPSLLGSESHFGLLLFTAFSTMGLYSEVSKFYTSNPQDRSTEMYYPVSGRC
jgi:hypothetical protein